MSIFTSQKWSSCKWWIVIWQNELFLTRLSGLISIKTYMVVRLSNKKVISEPKLTFFAFLYLKWPFYTTYNLLHLVIKDIISWMDFCQSIIWGIVWNILTTGRCWSNTLVIDLKTLVSEHYCYLVELQNWLFSGILDFLIISSLNAREGASFY